MTWAEHPPVTAGAVICRHGCIPTSNARTSPEHLCDRASAAVVAAAGTARSRKDILVAGKRRKGDVAGDRDVPPVVRDASRAELVDAG